MAHYQTSPVAYRRPPNLRNFLVQAAYRQLKESNIGGNSRCTCRQPHCKMCAHIHVQCKIGHHVPYHNHRWIVLGKGYCRLSDQQHHLHVRNDILSWIQIYKYEFSFNSFAGHLHVLYQMKQCSIQYVGETKNALHIRLTGHRSDINHHRSTNLSQDTLTCWITR